MDGFFINYKDPIFGIIILFGLITIISMLNYTWVIYKSKYEKKNIENFIKKFDLQKSDIAYKKLVNDLNVSTKTLSLLTHSYTKFGEYENAITLYLLILQKIEDKFEKKYVLTQLAMTYFKAGFLQKAVDIFLESLKLSPRNEQALSYLSVCFIRLKKYDNAIEVLDSLMELGVDVENQKVYIKVLKLLNSDKTIEKKIEKINLYKNKFPLATRMLYEYIIKKNLNYDENLLNELKIHESFDLMWYVNLENFDINKLNNFYKQIARAKGYDIDVKVDIFELEVLSCVNSKKEKASLEFIYSCSNCKSTYPMFFYRCPTCHALASADIKSNIIRKNNEINLPF